MKRSPLGATASSRAPLTVPIRSIVKPFGTLGVASSADAHAAKQSASPHARSSFSLSRKCGERSVLIRAVDRIAGDERNLPVDRPDRAAAPEAPAGLRIERQEPVARCEEQHAVTYGGRCGLSSQIERGMPRADQTADTVLRDEAVRVHAISNTDEHVGRTGAIGPYAGNRK